MKKYHGYALVTGGDAGIGFAIAEELAKNGQDLLIVGRTPEHLKEAKKKLTSQYKVDVITLEKDLTSISAAKEIYDFTQEKGIHVGLLVNNAGFGISSLLETSQLDQQVKMVQLMCRSMLELTHQFIPGMIAKREGGVIIISSIASRSNMPHFVVYGACKAFEESFGTTLNFELQSKGIDVLVVCPAFVKTSFQEVAGMKEVVDAKQEKLIGFKYITPEYVAQKTMKSLGKKVIVFVGNLPDYLIFYTNYFIPVKLRRIVIRHAARLWFDIKGY